MTWHWPQYVITATALLTLLCFAIKGKTAALISTALQIWPLWIGGF